MTLSKPIRFMFAGFAVTALAALVFMVSRSSLDEDEDCPVAPTSASSLPSKEVILDAPYDIGKVVSIIKAYDFHLAVRLVMDSGVPVADYKKTVDALPPHTNIMVEVLDSEELSDYSADWIRTRAKRAFRALGNRIGIRGIGNELDGKWTGSSSRETNAKTKAAYDIVRRHSGGTAITLSYWFGPDCYTHDWESTLSYTQTLRSDFSKIDCASLFVYGTVCTSRQHPSTQGLSKTLRSLGKYFPNTYLEIDEMGTQRPGDDGIAEPDFAEKSHLANCYYDMHGQIRNSVDSRYAGGHFWWYSCQDTTSAPAA